MLNPTEIKKLRTMVSADDPRLPAIFGVLGDPTRCKVFRSFLKRDRLCVSDVSRALNISMSLASQHLKTLEMNKLITREKEGRVAYFRPNTSDELVTSIINAVE